jgi:hypothetical protein
MLPEWITAVGTIILALGVVGTLIGVFIKFSVSVQANTQAIKTLTDYMTKQDARNDKQDEKLEDHETRIVKIETVHELEGKV